MAPPVRPIQPVEATRQAPGSVTQTIFSRAARIIFNPVAPRSDTQPVYTGPATIEPPPGILPTADQIGESLRIGEIVGKPVAVAPYKPAVEKAKQPAGPIRVSVGVQMAKLVNRVIPVYPPLAKASHTSGVVHLIGIISKDGTIRDLKVISGNPLLIKAALDAVSQWVYKPTLLNNEAVEVIAPIDVNFILSNQVVTY